VIRHVFSGHQTPPLEYCFYCFIGVILKQRKYEETFKMRIVGLFQRGVPQYVLMREFGLTKCRIQEWRKKFPHPIMLDDNGELSRLSIENMHLQKRVEKLEKENEVLKEATRWVEKKRDVERFKC
jgi:transposase-like protein